MLAASPARIVLDSKGDILLAGISAAIGMVHGPIVNVCPHKSTGKPSASCAHDAPEPTTGGFAFLDRADTATAKSLSEQACGICERDLHPIHYVAFLLDQERLVSCSRWLTRSCTTPNC